MLSLYFYEPGPSAELLKKKTALAYNFLNQVLLPPRSQPVLCINQKNVLLNTSKIRDGWEDIATKINASECLN